MNAEHAATKRQRKAIDVALKPCMADGHAVQVDPEFIVVFVFEDDVVARLESEVVPAVDDSGYDAIAGIEDGNVQDCKPGWDSQEEWQGDQEAGLCNEEDQMQS